MQISTLSWFEDFRLGQRFEGGERAVTAADIERFAAISGDRHPIHTDASHARASGFAKPILHGPFVVAAFFGWFHELGLASRSVLSLLDTNWRYLAPIHADDSIHFEMTITRCRLASSGDRGVVGRYVRVFNQRYELTQEGSTSMLVKARGRKRNVGQELMTPRWSAALAELLNASDGFRSATATWDGTIGLAGDSGEVQLRIYRGRVIEGASRTPLGATFTLAASDLSWAQLVSAPANDFMRRAMAGEFSVRGAAFEYLRLTKALSLLIDAARSLFAAEETNVDPR